MVIRAIIILLLITASFTKAYALKGRWKDYDINDPSLTLDTVAIQCDRSLIYAVEQLEMWCEKAYDMGDWRALSTIGLHTGDGSRYVNEAKKQVAAGDANALTDLAWLYSQGRFVERNTGLAISLYNQYLAHKDSQNITTFHRTNIHHELYLLYNEIEDKDKAAKHLQFLIDHAENELQKARLLEKMKTLKASSTAPID